MNPLTKNIENISYIDLWKQAFGVRYVVILAVLLGMGCVMGELLPQFLLYKESVDGALLFDPITSNFTPIDFNPYIFYITTGLVILGHITSILTPRGLMQVLATMCLLNMIRMLSLYLVDLNPPTDIIPLWDPLLEKTFYDNVLITKDLFFSGHTSNIVVFGFLTQVKWLRKVFFVMAFVVGAMLILQHVHYTIDVAAAPIFAYVVYRFVDRVIDIIATRFFSKRSQS